MQTDPLRQRVTEIRRRLRAVAVGRAALRTLFWSACGFAVVAVVERLVWFGIPLPVLAAGAAIVAGLVALVAGAMRRPTDLEAALAADAQARLKERLASALSLGEPTSDMERALVADARARAEAVRVEEAAPFVPPRETSWLPAPLVLALVAVLVLPQWDLFGRKAAAAAAAADAAILKDQAKKLDQKRKQILERARAKKLDQEPKTARELDKIAELMKSPSADRKEAMAKISKLSDDLKEDKDKLADKLEAARQAMQALSRRAPAEETPLEKLVREGKFGQAARELQKMREQLAKGDMPADEQQKLQDALSRMGDQLAKQMDKMGGDGPGSQGLQDMAKGLQDAAKSLEGGGAQGQKALEDLAKGLEGLDMDLGELEAMEDLLKDLDDLKDGLADGKPCEGASGEG